MTRDRAKELLPIITAFAEGKVIQKRFQLSLEQNNPWTDYDDPEFMSEICSEFDFRIKPEPKLRPFTQGEACAFRLFKCGSLTVQPHYYKRDGVQVGGNTLWTYSQLCNETYWQCSTGIPNSKGELEWQRCGIEVNE